VFRAVVFDLLTALLDSWSLWNRVAGSDEVGLAWRREYLRLTYGAGGYRPYEGIIQEAAASTGVTSAQVGALLARWAELTPWPEAPGVVRALRARGLAVAVATNCSNALAKLAVDALDVPIDVVVTAEAAGYFKPHPRPYRLALERIACPPDKAVFVAGSASDVPGAAGVGMAVFWHNRMQLPALASAPAPVCVAPSLSPILTLVDDDARDG